MPQDHVGTSFVPCCDYPRCPVETFMCPAARGRLDNCVKNPDTLPGAGHGPRTMPPYPPIETVGVKRVEAFPL